MYRMASRMTSNFETVVFREMEGTRFLRRWNSTAVDEADSFSTPDPDWTPLWGSAEAGDDGEDDVSRFGDSFILTTILKLIL